MRQIFTAHPYISPKEPEAIARWIRAHGTRREVARGEVLKYGGEGNRLFLVESGLCAYYVAEHTGDATIMSLLPPGRTIGDMTATAHAQCNVLSKALLPSVVYVCSPVEYRTMLLEHPDVMALKLSHAILKEESTLEGMVANCTRSPEERLKILFQVMLLDAGKEDEKQTADAESWHLLPYRLSAEVIGEVIHLKRPTVALLESRFVREGLLKKTGRDRWVKRALFAGIYDWLDRGSNVAPPSWH